MTLRSEFRRALDHAFARTPFRRTVTMGAGPVAFAFADAEEAEVFPEAFRTIASGPAALEIAMLVGPDETLERLVPPTRAEFHTWLDDEIYVNWQPTPGEILQIHDAATERGLMWLPTGQALETVRSRPALPIFHAHLSRSAWAPAHAAAIGRSGRFLLLAGDSGAGKSTAAVACAAAGWDYAGDDFVLVHPEQRRVEPIYASARLRPGGAALLGDFVEKAQVAITDDYGFARNELRLGPGYTNVTIVGGNVAAILLPRRGGGDTITFRPAKPQETFLAMVSVTLLQLPGFRESLVPKLMRLMRSVPSYVVDTGNDPRAIPAAFDRFLEELA